MFSTRLDERFAIFIKFEIVACNVFQVRKGLKFYIKGGHLDFSHLTELRKNIYHWNLYEKTIQIINRKITKKTIFWWYSLNAFPHNETFWRPWETSPLKTLWEKHSHELYDQAN